MLQEILCLSGWQKGTKIKRFTYRNSREKAASVAILSFANTSERSKGQNIQPQERLFEEINKSMAQILQPQLKLKLETRLSSKDVWTACTIMTPMTDTGDPERS